MYICPVTIQCTLCTLEQIRHNIYEFRLAPKCFASFIFQNYCEIIVKLLLKSYDVSRCNVEQELLKDQLKKMLRKALRWKIQNMKLNLRTK